MTAGAQRGDLSVIKPSILILAAALFAAPALAQAADPAAPPAAAAMPMCSAKVHDACQQTKGQEARAMNAAQADARDAKMATPTDKMAGPAPAMGDAAAKPMMMKKHHRHHHKHMAKMAPMAAGGGDTGGADAPK